MSVTTELQSTDTDIKGRFGDQFSLPYRELSRGAVISVILAGLSLLSILFAALLPIPLIGLIIGLLAWRAIRKCPLELTGKGFAAAGSVACGLILVGATAGHVAAFSTSIPEGYENVSFDLLRTNAPGEDDFVPDTAMALNGKKVFIRGYLHPSVASLGPIQQFVVVADFETCCFGGQPKLTHMIEVTTPPNQPVQYSLRRRGFAGTLKVDRRLKSVDGLGGVFYQLRADIIK